MHFKFLNNIFFDTFVEHKLDEKTSKLRPKTSSDFSYQPRSESEIIRVETFFKIYRATLNSILSVFSI